MANEHMMNYVELPNSAKQALPGGQESGTLDPHEQMEISIYLRPRAGQPLSLAPDARMTREEYAASYGADPADVAQIVAFAQAHGLTVVQTDLARRVVVLAGTIDAMMRAFKVDLRRFTHEGQAYRARTGTIQVPQVIAPMIESILGLDNRDQARPHFRILAEAAVATSPHHPNFLARLFNPTASPRATATGGLTGAEIAQLYHYPTAATGQGETIALIELGGGYNPQDLQTYFSGLNITPPTVTSVAVDGTNNAPQGDPNSADGEVTLDIEIAGAVAPGAAIAVYFAPNTDQGFIDAISTAVHDTQRRPSIISISWGGPESSWTTQATQQMDQIFQQAAALGVTICCAAGDSGSDDGVGDGKAHVDFPASSPNVLACGGTRLAVNGTAISSETVWNGGSNDGATGGGVSDRFGLPSWQAAAQVPPSVNAGSHVGRGVPDVAGDADPQSGYAVLVDGQSTIVGGTSAVAPLYAGLIALLNQRLGRSVGFLNPILYQHATVARDVTSGNNAFNGAPGYSAGPGWDACTGLGVVDGAQLLTVLQAGH